MSDRTPRPMSQDRLKAYRWTTELARPAMLQQSDDEEAIHLEIGAVSRPHIFAVSPDRTLPKLESADLWGYGPAGAVTYPGPTLVAERAKELTVNFKNDLPFKPHGATLPFTEPMGDQASGGMGRGAMGRYATGTAVVHLHGAALAWEYDGHPVRIPEGPDNPQPAKTVIRSGETRKYVYPNRQRGGGMLWYHDHTMDLTARNVYAGLAGGYILRAPLEQDYIEDGILPSGEFEVPLILQDRSFTEEGQLLYGDAVYLKTCLDAADAALKQANGSGLGSLRGLARAGVAAGCLSPMAEFKGHALLVNGKVWPTLKVKPRVYRFRILNGSNSRFYVLRLSKEKLADAAPIPDTQRIGASPITQDPALEETSAGPLIQIGSDGALFERAVVLDGTDLPDPGRYLVLAPGERADVLVDFSKLKDQKSVFLTNHTTGSAPFGISGDELNRFAGADKDPDELLGNVMRFDLGGAEGEGVAGPLSIKGTAPDNLNLEYYNTQDRSLNNILSEINKIEDEEILSNIKDYIPISNLNPNNAIGAPYVFSIQEFGGLHLSKYDQKIPIYPIGRHPWAAITFSAGSNEPKVPGYLWARQMPKEITGDPPDNICPPPMGGPAYDGDRDQHSGKPHIELWEIWNYSGDTHPIHLHLVNFKVLERRPTVAGNPFNPVMPNEAGGWKDTVRAHPGEVLRLLVQFVDNGGSTNPFSNFVWHCHLIEHEDMGMMRPMRVSKGN